MSFGDEFFKTAADAAKIAFGATKAIQNKMTQQTKKVETVNTLGGFAPNNQATTNSPADFQKKMDFFKKYGRMPKDGEI